MADETEERDDGATIADVSPEDILGSPDDDVVPADTGDGEGEGEQEEQAGAEETPEGEPEGGEEEAQAETEEFVEEPAPETPEAEETPELVLMKVMHQGVEHEIEVTPEAAKAIEAQQITAGQLPHLQDKYVKTLEQMKELEAPPGTTADAEGQPQFSQEDFENAMKPRLDAAVKAGSIEEGFVTEFPKAAAAGVFSFDREAQNSQILASLAQAIKNDAEAAEINNFRSGVFSTMGEMASANPQIHGELADQANRESFFEFVVEKNPTVGQLTGDGAVENLVGLYAWYKKDELAAGASAANARAKSEQDDARLRAGGAGGGGGGRSKPKSKHPDIDAVLGN